MKNIIKINVYICLLLSIFSSCSDDSFDQIVTFDVPKVPPRLVINCNYTIGDDSIVVLVGKSRNVGDSVNFIRDEFKNAKVELLRNGVKLFDIPFFHRGSNKAQTTVFQLDKIASKMTEGATYTLKASLAGYENIEATQIVPSKALLSKPIFKEKDFVDNSIDGAGRKLDLVQFDLTDPAEENFYQIVTEAIVKDTINNELFYFSEYHTLDQLFSQGLFDDLGGTKHTIDDAIFNGKKFSFRLGVNLSSNNSWFHPVTSSTIEAKQIGFRATIFSLTKEKYIYEASLNALDNGASALFGEPVTVNTNIKNGFGIFSIRNVSLIDIPIP